MAEDARLRAVVGLTQVMAAAHTTREAVRAAALGAMAAMDGSFTAVSVWERERARIRVLVNVGELSAGEEEYPVDESYPVYEFPEIAGFPYDGPEEAGGEQAGGEQAPAWIETAARIETAEGPATPGTGPSRRALALRRRGRGCCVVAPIAPHGRVWGELCVARGVSAPVFGHADAVFATELAAVIGAGIAQNERLEEVRRLAFTDPLTGLANRRAVDARLAEALERHLAVGEVVSLVVCDINGLKRVNDVHGHAVGDRLLERFASVLSVCGAGLPGTLAARLGGDEFCLLAVGPEADEVVDASDELCRRAASLELGEGVAVGMASTGDAVGPVRTASRLFRLADAAQYQAKAGRSRKSVVAGRAGGRPDPVVRMADALSGPGGERRRFRDAR